MTNALIQELIAVAGDDDPYLAKRNTPRKKFDCIVSLEMADSDGQISLVTAINASREGIRLRTKKKLAIGDQIGLRLLDAPEGPFEPFVVQRVTQDLIGYCVGAAPL